MKRKLNIGEGACNDVVAVASSPAADQLHFTEPRQLRSRVPRRRRLHISPVVVSSTADSVSHFAAVSEAVSCDSSIASVGNSKKPSPARRVVTQFYYRKKKLRNETTKDQSEFPEISEENSCVVESSSSGAKLKLNLDIEKKLEFGEVSKSKGDDDVINSKAEEEDYYSSVGNGGVSVSNSTVDYEEIQKMPKLFGSFDLACSEQFSRVSVLDDDDEEEEQSSSEQEIWKIFSESEFDCSEFSQSIWSGSQFSEKSETSSSVMFQLFGVFKQQFCRSSTSSAFHTSSVDHTSASDFSFLGLEDEEVEENYKRLRERERRQVYLHDYAEEYCNSTIYGNLVIQQRLKMVHWIVEHATNEGLHQETMFLGVNLLDRFLSKGYFKSKMNIQIAGIACLTLATRIEEKQIISCIQRQSFFVGSTEYSRCEVVAMEWVVLEVLNFQCILPTLYNFLWFYLKAAGANEVVEKTSKYLAVLALMGHQQLCYWPSTVAAGLVVLASIAANQDASCHLIIEIHSRQKDKDLPKCIESLRWLVKYL